MTTVPNVVTTDIVSSYSDLGYMLRVTSYIFRFLNKCRKRADNRVYGIVSVCEKLHALHHRTRSAQRFEFLTELTDLRRSNVLKSVNTLISLNTFQDLTVHLRVGGRLSRSDLPYDHKYPVILPKRHYLTLLIIRQAHILDLHSGMNVTIPILRERYWIIHERNTIKCVIHQCVRCYRIRLLKSEYMMADSPPSRTTVSKPF